MRLHKGFTLIELLVVIAIIAILASIGVPGFRTLTLDNRLTGTTNSLLGALQLARSEALSQRATIKVCAANADNTACTNNTNWSSGALIMRGATVLRVVPSSNVGVSVQASRNDVDYLGNGTTVPATLTISDGRDDADREIRINAIGQACSGSACP